MNKEKTTGDIIIHETRTKFSLKDKIRVLFGSVVTVRSEIYTKHEECLVTGSSSKTYVDRIFPKKRNMKVGEGTI